MSSLASVLPRNVRAERVRRRWDQEEFGRRVGGWSRSMVSDLETGRRKVAVDDLAKLCRALELTLRELAVGCEPEDLRSLGI